MSSQDDDFEWFEVEKFMEDGKHFSHDHSLRLCVEKEEDEYVDEKDEEEEEEAYNNYLCGICGLPILCSTSYTCTITGCIFFIHQPCALKMTPSLIHPSHRCSRYGRNKLFIQKSSPNFTYNCEDCDFVIHPLVAVVPHVEIKIKHNSHPSHPLVAFCRVNLTMCDVCGKKHEQEGFFFSCMECNFWVHQECTILPKCIIIADHPQPFVLAYSLPYYQIEGDCIICRKPLLLKHNGVYFSPELRNFAHVHCGMDRIASKRTRLEIVKMPDDDEWDVFPSLVIRRYAERKPLELDDDDKNNKLTIEKYHKHPLKILNIDDEIIEACDLCTRPINKKISSSFYRCSDIDCHFAAHNICADILPILNFFVPEIDRPKLYPDPSARFFNSIFYCLFCHRPCNGLSYYFSEDDYPLLIDLECMAAPSIINHASHAQHLLFRTTRSSALTPLTCCLDDSFIYDVYRCIVCDYYIHIRCATLPKRIVRHEYDEHPLHLVFDPPPNQEMIMNCFCEVCEEYIDIKYWSYRCGECDKWFHVNCIPDVGYLSKVKFGGTLSLDDHLMSLTRMLTLPTQRCGYCKKLIQGYVDEMAFSCSLCHFWIHFSCARDHSSTSKPPMLRLYSEKNKITVVY